MPLLKSAKFILYWLKAVAAGLLIALSVFVVVMAVAGKSRSSGPFKPMISEAKALDLTYEQVVSAPAKYLEKHVIWCVQNRSREAVYYLDEPRRLTVENHPQMPLVIGSKHSSCEKMLLQIKAVNKTYSGSVIPEVKFISAL